MTTTNQVVTSTWTLIGSTSCLLQSQGSGGCLVFVGSNPTSSSAYIILKSGDTYTYTTSSDLLYARANDGLSTLIATIK